MLSFSINDYDIRRKLFLFGMKGFFSKPEHNVDNGLEKCVNREIAGLGKAELFMDFKSVFG